jgi:hypothetical protein
MSRRPTRRPPTATRDEHRIDTVAARLRARIGTPSRPARDDRRSPPHLMASNAGTIKRPLSATGRRPHG